MRTAPRLMLLCVLLLAGLFLACGGDDDDDASDGTPTRTPAASRLTSTPRPTDSDEKTPGPDESPDGSTPTEAPTPGPTRAPEGTPAIAPDDQVAFLNQFANKDVQGEPCTYDPGTFIVTCPDRGRFAIDPPLIAQDVTCSIGIVDGNPEYINCISVEPRQAIYYDIQG